MNRNNHFIPFSAPHTSQWLTQNSISVRSPCPKTTKADSSVAVVMQRTGLMPDCCFLGQIIYAAERVQVALKLSTDPRVCSSQTVWSLDLMLCNTVRLLADVS